MNLEDATETQKKDIYQSFVDDHSKIIFLSENGRELKMVKGKEYFFKDIEPKRNTSQVRKLYHTFIN